MKLSLLAHLKQCLRDYQTRQQLKQLPAHLYGDIGKNKRQVDTEVARSVFRRITTGGSHG